MAKRLPKVNQLIKKELGKLIFRAVDLPENVLATVTRVETSSDLNETKVYISSFPEEKLERVVSLLNKQVYELQQKLNRRLNMRPIPRISFVKERETAEASKIEEVLERIKRENIEKVKEK